MSTVSLLVNSSLHTRKPSTSIAMPLLGNSSLHTLKPFTSIAMPLLGNRLMLQSVCDDTDDDPKYLLIPCLPVGATALVEPWPPLQPVSTVQFLNKIIFYRMGLSAPCPTPNLEDQGVSLSLDSAL
jgi:hypothetical protein